MIHINYYRKVNPVFKHFLNFNLQCTVVTFNISILLMVIVYKRFVFQFYTRTFNICFQYCIMMILFKLKQPSLR